MPQPKEGQPNSSATSQAISQSVLSCLANGAWRSYHGPNLSLLEQWFNQQFGVKHVRLCSSGTLGVELALRSLHLKPGDEVILSAYDFPGNFRCIEDIGAKPVLCRPNVCGGWVLSVADLEQCVGPETKAIIVSHLHGQTAPVQEIVRWARSCNLLVVEDACQAIGGSIEASDRSEMGRRSLGTVGDVGVFSLGGSKLISAGRGGVVITQSDLFAQRMRHYCERGNDAFALSEIQAAIALPQCRRLHEDHALRERSARALVAQLATIPGLIPVSIEDGTSQAFYKIGVRLLDNGSVSQEIGARKRDAVVADLLSQGIHAGDGFRSFAKRSTKRFRSPHDLALVEELANSTMVIHHDHLLHPTTGADSTKDVYEAFQRIAAKLF